MNSMFYKIMLLLIFLNPSSCMISIQIINNAIFSPANSSYLLGNQSGVASRGQCICQCYSNSHCITAIYYGRYQICSFYSVELSQGQLQLMLTIENTTVISFVNSNRTGRLLERFCTSLLYNIFDMHSNTYVNI